ncbi:GntR family transcriptional regulator [Fredinandcohnia sp. 179-A 10B2 NHS]|uniref:GntR family transcriptional regulator n=1 Tax=Fredinandcohnia sp. 179-A 10B2 NHS TaxID=3235176 RepID=UPI0039A19787
MNIYEQIKEKIIEGAYKPGERLTEEFLASDLNISRTPIREALRQLQVEGLLIPLKRGVVVKEYTKEDVRKLYDIRILLEGHMAYQAALYRSDEDIQRLEEANEKYRNLIDIFDEEKNIMRMIMKTNSLFHDAVCNAAQNEYICFLRTKVVIAPLVYQSLYWYDIDRLKRSVNAHQSITNAIIEKDGNRAKTAMLEHMYQGRETVLKLGGLK